jgi:hypothetical protein
MEKLNYLLFYKYDCHYKKQLDISKHVRLSEINEKRRTKFDNKKIEAETLKLNKQLEIKLMQLETEIKYLKKKNNLDDFKSKNSSYLTEIKSKINQISEINLIAIEKRIPKLIKNSSRKNLENAILQSYIFLIKYNKKFNSSNEIHF